MSFRTGVAIAALVLAAGHGGVCAPPDDNVVAEWTEGGVTTEMRFRLTDTEREALAAQALDGSGVAAWRLSLFFMTRPEGRREEGMRWAQIAAENGEPAHEHGYGVHLLIGALGTHDPASTRRGCFWVRRAARNGYSRAKEYLRLERNQCRAQ